MIQDQVDEHALDAEEIEQPLSIIHKNFFTGVSHHQRQDMFATSGSVVELWSLARSEPMQSFNWGSDTYTSVKFNPIEV